MVFSENSFRLALVLRFILCLYIVKSGNSFDDFSLHLVIPLHLFQLTAAPAVSACGAAVSVLGAGSGLGAGAGSVLGAGAGAGSVLGAGAGAGSVLGVVAAGPVLIKTVTVSPACKDPSALVAAHLVTLPTAT